MKLTGGDTCVYRYEIFDFEAMINPMSEIVIQKSEL